MTCAKHPETAAVAYCRSCGIGLCEGCRRTGNGIIYCAEHLPAGASEAPPPAPAPSPAPGAGNPGLAFLLGLIPGVGAIYNGQYAKGLVHAIVFGLLISIGSSSPGAMEPMVVMMTIAFVFYMAFEARHTACKRLQGAVVDEFSSLVDMKGGSSNAGAITLIVVGVVFLLNTLEIVHLRQVVKFWPVLLIALGASMLYSRIRSESGGTPSGGGPFEPKQEVQHERQ
ncbi:MAG: hypothetical protein HYR60_29415 [Acidobacteria bacterium]|nr:hypothetical protein [Acidobacteriota bacterium]MBI3474048.1 hypothetical protein [Candidatus Solibacter usitatus]